MKLGGCGPSAPSARWVCISLGLRKFRGLQPKYTYGPLDRIQITYLCPLAQSLGINRGFAENPTDLLHRGSKWPFGCLIQIQRESS